MAKPRTSRSRANVVLDTSEVVAWERRLDATRRIIDDIRDDWEEEWSNEWADQMRNSVPVSTWDRSPGSERYGHLRDNIQVVSRGGSRTAGGITFGDSFWWRFLEYGTSKMPPQPFVRPTMKRIRTPARKDAISRAVDALTTRRA